MAKNIVIVESPAKAKTIERFLGKEYHVTSSYGHIADLPSNEMGEDTEGNFDPKYIIPNDKTNLSILHEITETAILNAIKNPRGIDYNLVNAHQARRVVDRWVGYELSPVRWRKVKGGVSAGRVQSVSVRLIVERERASE